MATNSHDMNMFLELCHQYAQDWKMEFNQSKSNFTTFGNPIIYLDIHMNSKKISFILVFQ